MPDNKKKRSQAETELQRKAQDRGVPVEAFLEGGKSERLQKLQALSKDTTIEGEAKANLEAQARQNQIAQEEKTALEKRAQELGIAEPQELPTLEEFQKTQPTPTKKKPSDFFTSKTPQQVFNPENTLEGSAKATAGIVAAVGGGLVAPRLLVTASSVGKAGIASATVGSTASLAKALGIFGIGGALTAAPRQLIKDSEKALEENEQGMKDLISGFENGEVDEITMQQAYLDYLRNIDRLERANKIYSKADVTVYLGGGQDTLAKIESAKRLSTFFAQQIINAGQQQRLNTARASLGVENG